MRKTQGLYKEKLACPIHKKNSKQVSSISNTNVVKCTAKLQCRVPAHPPQVWLTAFALYHQRQVQPLTFATYTQSSSEKGHTINHF